MKNATKLKLQMFWRRARTNKVIAIFAGLIVLASGYFLISSQAAGFFAAVEPDTGTVTGNAQIVSDGNASSGKAVQFNAPPVTPPPTPPPGGTRSCPGKPDTSCTGVTPGVTLTVVNGNQTYGPSFNGQTISGKDFHGFVYITGANITFKDCIFRGASSNGNSGLVNTDESTGTITIQDSEVVPSNPSVALDGMWLANSNVYRVHVHGSVVDGIKTFGDVLIEDSYIHGMLHYDHDPNQGGEESHNDGVQSWSGLANTTLRHNNIDISDTFNGNAAWQDSSPNSRAENNWLDGGNCTLNFSHGQMSSFNGLYILNNRFGRHRAYANCVILISNSTTITQISGNVWDDTGQPAPAPEQHN